MVGCVCGEAVLPQGAPKPEEVLFRNVGTANEVSEPRNTPCAFVFVLQEPPIEEAQPAWWLELERSEARQNKAEKASSLTQKAVLTPAVPSNFVPGVEGRKVRFVSEPAADHHGFYENDTEFVISPAQPSTMTSPMQASEQSEAPLWDLSDLDDVAAIRRMLISTVDTPRSSSVGSFSASSSMDFHWSNHPSDAEPVFSGYYGSSVDRARPGV